MLSKGLFHTIADLLASTFDLLRVFNLILDHLLVVSFTLNFCKLLVWFLLLFAHTFPYTWSEPCQSRPYCFTVLKSYVIRFFFIVNEETRDGSLRPMWVILAVCCFDLSLTDAFDLRVDCITLLIITLFVLKLFEPLQSLDVLQLIWMLLDVLGNLFSISLFICCHTIIVCLFDLDRQFSPRLCN